MFPSILGHSNPETCTRTQVERKTRGSSWEEREREDWNEWKDNQDEEIEQLYDPDEVCVCVYPYIRVWACNKKRLSAHWAQPAHKAAWMPPSRGMEAASIEVASKRYTVGRPQTGF